MMCQFGCVSVCMLPVCGFQGLADSSMQSWQPMGRYFCTQHFLYNALAECVHGRWRCKFNRIEQSIFILARSMSSRIRNRCDDPCQYRFIKQGSTIQGNGGAQEMVPYPSRQKAWGQLTWTGCRRAR